MEGDEITLVRLFVPFITASNVLPPCMLNFDSFTFTTLKTINIGLKYNIHAVIANCAAKKQQPTITLNIITIKAPIISKQDVTIAIKAMLLPYIKNLCSSKH